MTAAQKAAELSVRIEALRTGVAAAEAKRARISQAILSRRKLQSQLEAKLTLISGNQPAPVTNYDQ